MSHFSVTSRKGKTIEIEGRDGIPVMELIRSAGVDELLAICGGGCSCATCHVFVDATHFAMLEPITDDEEDLLDSSMHRTETSRLSCQVRWRADLDGMQVTLAPED